LIKNINIKQWWLLAIGVRLLVMPFSLHGDLIHIVHWPHLIVHGDWDAFGAADRAGVNYYGPVLLLLLAGYEKLICSVFPGVETFLHALLDYDFTDYANLSPIFFPLFLLKAPNLIFDSLLIWICLKMISGDEEKKAFVIHWGFNPVIIYSFFIVGQCDLIALFFVALSWYLLSKKSEGNWAMVSLAAGCMIKVFPILFMPVIALIASRSIKDFIRLSLYGLVPLIFFYGVFYLISGNSLFAVLHIVSNYKSSGGPTEIEWSKIFFLGSQMIVFFGVCWRSVFWRKEEDIGETLLLYILAIFCVFEFGLFYYSTHYVSWFVPFVILFIIRRPQWSFPFYFLMGLVFVMCLRSREVSFGIFAPINSNLFYSIPSPQDVFGFFFDLNTFYSVINFGIKGLFGFFLLLTLKELFMEPLIKLKRSN